MSHGSWLSSLYTLTGTCLSLLFAAFPFNYHCPLWMTPFPTLGLLSFCFESCLNFLHKSTIFTSSCFSSKYHSTHVINQVLWMDGLTQFMPSRHLPSIVDMWTGTQSLYETTFSESWPTSSLASLPPPLNWMPVLSVNSPWFFCCSCIYVPFQSFKKCYFCY